MYQSQFIEMFGSVDYNPKSYNIKKVGDFAVCFAGATPSTKIPSYWDNGNIPWMSSGEVHKGRVQDTDTKITKQGYDGCSTKMVPIHSIVVALAGQGKTRGTVAINDIELCTNQSLCAIVPNEEVNYEYLFHNLRGRYRELRSMSGDVDGRGGLNLKHIQSIKVIVPPMSEQMKFVSIAQQADKSKFLGLKSQFIEMFGGHSTVVKLKDVVTIMDDKRKPINEGERSAMKDGELYPYYGATGVVDYINDYLTDERLLCIAEDCGNYGPGEESSYIIEGKAWVNNHAHVVKPNDELCDITYLHNYLKVTDLLPFVSGTTRKKLTQKAMSDLDIILPQIDKQREYVSICDQADKSKQIAYSRAS